MPQATRGKSRGFLIYTKYYKITEAKRKSVLEFTCIDESVKIYPFKILD